MEFEINGLDFSIPLITQVDTKIVIVNICLIVDIMIKLNQFLSKQMDWILRNQR